MLSMEDLQSASSQCVHFVEGAEVDGVAAKVREAELICFEADATGVANAESLFHRLAESMKFPEYFGMNWDALDEVLDDFSWEPGTGYVLILKGAESLWTYAPRVAGSFVEAWLTAADEWSYDGVPFHLIFVW